MIEKVEYRIITWWIILCLAAVAILLSVFVAELLYIDDAQKIGKIIALVSIFSFFAIVFVFTVVCIVGRVKTKRKIFYSFGNIHMINETGNDIVSLYQLKYTLAKKLEKDLYHFPSYRKFMLTNKQVLCYFKKPGEVVATWGQIKRKARGFIKGRHIEVEFEGPIASYRILRHELGHLFLNYENCPRDAQHNYMRLFWGQK